MDRIEHGDRDWLDEHKPVVPFGAIEVGKMVLASHGGNVWVAMHTEPDLRLETALAWFAGSGDAETLRRRVRHLGDFIDAGDEARRGD